MSIQPLPEDVIAQIKSSTTITSLNGVIFELMQNCLDAGSTKVEISVDYSRGGCVVEDDGLGILPSEFGENGGLGKLCYSSKLNPQTSVHGNRGSFLASLSAMSLLSITSHHHLHRSQNTLNMHRAEVVSRQVPAPAQQHLSRFDHGTRVTVRNLFGNMPVRVKQRAIISEKQGATNKEWESLKSSLVSLLLAWPKTVALTLQNLATDQKMVMRGPSRSDLSNEVPRVFRILSQSLLITPDENSWVSVRASTTSLKLSGAISLDPSPTKHVQFLSFGIQPLLPLEGKSILHDEINRMFLNSSFGSEEEGEELDEAELSRRAKDARYTGGGFTNKELKGGKKGVDRWPMFYINIQRTTSLDVSKVIDQDDMLDDKGNSLTSIIEVLQAIIFEFLTRHHFRPKILCSSRLNNAIATEEAAVNEDDAPQPRGRRTVELAEPPSAKRASPKPVSSMKKKSVQLRSTDSELLGANVKLPSFRRSPSAAESPFDGWSRIKTGAAKSGLEKTDGLSSDHEIQQLSTARPSSSSSALTLRSSRPSTPLISSTGKVVRRPFEDIPMPSNKSQSTPVRPTSEQPSNSTAAASQSPSASIDLTDGIDVVAWINPITKVKSLINKQTGHTLPTVNTTASRLSTRSLLSAGPSSVTMLSSIHDASMPSELSPWLTSLLEKWENPIFRPTEPSIPQVSLDGVAEHVLHGHRHNCSQLDIDRAFAETSSGIAGRVSKAALKDADVIGQVDRKFVLINVPISEGRRESQSGKMLLIIDQHAADERVRIEKLLAELCTPAPPRFDGLPNESLIVTTYLEKDILFDVSAKECELLASQKSRFADWGILYDTSMARNMNSKTLRTDLKPKHILTIRALPPGIAERCKSDSKMLLDLIRTELYFSNIPSSLPPPASHSSNSSTSTETKIWLSKIHNCPTGLLSMLNSRACRSAIMFNDVLTKEQCEILVRRLAETAFPFQCAHGRPSLVPLVALGSVQRPKLTELSEGQGGLFGRAFNNWKVRMG